MALIVEATMASGGDSIAATGDDFFTFGVNHPQTVIIQNEGTDKIYVKFNDQAAGVNTADLDVSPTDWHVMIEAGSAPFHWLWPCKRVDVYSVASIEYTGGGGDKKLSIIGICQR